MLDTGLFFIGLKKGCDKAEPSRRHHLRGLENIWFVAA